MATRMSLIALFIAGMMLSVHVKKAYTAHPLITDDTGTQGKGVILAEIVGEYGKDTADGITVHRIELPIAPFISYGISDTLDLVLGPSHMSIRTDDGISPNTVRGITDASFELKARLYEKDGLSFAVKPGISFPSGDEGKGLGKGRASLTFTLITTLIADSLAYHLNLRYARKEFKLPADMAANRRDIWHASIAAEVSVSKELVLVGNIGIERNPDKTSDTHPAFVLGGIIYSLRENVDIDFGIKGGISSAETDISFLMGIAWRY